MIRVEDDSMVTNRVIPAGFLFALVTIPALLSAQPVPDSARTSLGIRAGYVWPFGEWTKSVVAPTVDLVGISPGFEADLEFRIASRWTLGVEGGYSSLNGSNWEEYAAGTGDKLSVSGSFIHFALLLRPHLLVGSPNIVRVEVGPAMLLANGEEKLDGQTYTYDFLSSTSFGVQAGVEYIHVFNETVAVSLKAAGLFFPSAVQYVGGRSNTIIMMPVSAGIRFLL
jgi:hypothetical protein